MKVSDKIDAEFINESVFRITDKLRKDEVFYKGGLIILSGVNDDVSKKLQSIDRLTGIVDSYVLKKDMKKALLYTALLRKKVSGFIKEVKDTKIVLPSAY
ncbi:MAG: hypothetical protein E7505_04125 [Ruminococcus sp.]|nr:hypothetical protein [Ruminococcus sp.]